jgi:hypothetical protein
MNASGVRKMCQGWLAVIDIPDYIEAFANKKWIGCNVKNI